MASSNDTVIVTRDSYHDKCFEGLILPILEEHGWNPAFRGVLYFFGLLYCFLGIAIVADIFMGAIETITSKTRKVFLASPSATEEPEVIEVFAVTTIFSLFAYIWLLVIVVLSSPGEIELWESILTFVFFPVLVLVAFAADRGMFGTKKNKNKKQIELEQTNGEEGEKMIHGKTFFRNGKLEKDALVAFVKEVKKYQGLSDEDAALLAATKLVDTTPHSKMWYRIGAVRNISGGRKIRPQLSMKLREVYDTINEHPDAPNLGPVMEPDISNAILEFHAATMAVPESVGRFYVTVTRHGNIGVTAKVRVESIDGTANVNEDYKPVNEIITFEPKETEKKVMVEIVDDNQWEPDEEFFLKMSLISTEDNSEVQLGRVSIMEITIMNDDEPGILSFHRRGILVKESAGTARITVVRTNGADGEVSVKWKTKDKSAISGRDYMGGEGVIHFNHNEVERNIEIEIIDDMEVEKDEHFEVELFEPTGGAKLGRNSRMAVTITNDDDVNNVMDHLMLMTNTNMDAVRVHQDTWINQIKDAMNVNGGDLENASGADYVMHFLTFGWKIAFAMIPPPGLFGGWPCFFVSLAVIGLITAIVGDLASIFGCIVNLEDSVTAITLVAMGTSLPDMFASRAAAVQEKHADNAIGNITGSNSVNVFLGLGLPWMFAAIYHASKGTKFMVPPGGLGFSVMVFTLVAILAIIVLILRRKLTLFGKAELGGPFWPKMFSVGFLISLWLLYIVLSSLQAYKIITIDF
ncbi:hypothetical protein B566_EDAN006753 [Ephemera danica]|nr:hypothetical protein B566_EDAN006753 [Ephemera danica]